MPALIVYPIYAHTQQHLCYVTFHLQAVHSMELALAARAFNLSVIITSTSLCLTAKHYEMPFYEAHSSLDVGDSAALLKQATVNCILDGNNKHLLFLLHFFLFAPLSLSIIRFPLGAEYQQLVIFVVSN